MPYIDAHVHVKSLEDAWWQQDFWRFLNLLNLLSTWINSCKCKLENLKSSLVKLKWFHQSNGPRLVPPPQCRSPAGMKPCNLLLRANYSAASRQERVLNCFRSSESFKLPLHGTSHSCELKERICRCLLVAFIDKLPQSPHYPALARALYSTISHIPRQLQLFCGHSSGNSHAIRYCTCAEGTAASYDVLVSGTVKVCEPSN